MAQVIRSGLGAVNYVDVTVPHAAADTGYQVALGSPVAPGPWQTPDVVDVVDPERTRLRLLVGNGHYNPVSGRYRLWWRKSTAPETFVQTTGTVEIITDSGQTVVGVNPTWATVGDVSLAVQKLMAVVDHGNDPNVTRPAGAIAVTWRGFVAPVNAVPGDMWRDRTNTPAIERVKTSSLGWRALSTWPGTTPPASPMIGDMWADTSV